ncbi:MAG: hypothetical protein K6A64_03665 [Bacteroidales bacterium]|nr:hypothetical protein [Bacteroidales bacterium]
MKSKIISVIWLVASVAVAASCNKPVDYDYSRFYVDPYASDGGRMISVMSFNWRSESIGDVGEFSWASRRPAVAAMLKDRSPILMGCQECDPVQRKDILADDPRYGAVGIDLGYNKEEPECDAIFYLKDSVDIIVHGTFFLTTTPDSYSHLPQSNHYRVCTWARVRLKSDSTEFYHFNTHLDYIAEAQPIQMETILAKVKAINADNLPVFLTADWNAEEDSSIFKELRKTFKSAREEAVIGDAYRTYNGFGKAGNGQTLDHCWYKGFSSVTRFTTVRDKYAGITYISDHYPISITLKF